MKPNGGPVFPTGLGRIDGDAPFEEGKFREAVALNTGMSLRQYFAAHAPAMTEQWFKDSGGARHWLEAEASWRFAYADAMIAEGSKP